MTTHPVAPPRAILFDWDNTLVDTWPIIHEALAVTFEAMGAPAWTFEETRRRVGRSLRESFPRLFGARWREAAEIYFQAYEARHLERLVAMPGAERMLGALREQGLYLAVISNKTGRYLRREAEKLGWSAYFSSLVGAGDAPRDKPAPDPVVLAMAGARVTPGPLVWFVGDSSIDMELAHGTGCVPVLLRERAPEETEFARHPPAMHLRSCDELVELMNNP